MQKKVLELKPYVNKKTKQISLVLPKRSLEKFREKTPQSIKIKIKEIKW